MGWMRWAGPGLLGLSVHCSAGLKQPPADRRPVPVATNRAASSRPDEGRRFSKAIFLKPIASESTAWALAPIIVQEVVSGEPAEMTRLPPGAVTVTSSGRVRIEGTRPTIYAGSATAMIHGVPREQSVFVWFHAANGGSLGRPGWQAIRMTPDRAGYPAIIEAFSGSDTRDRIYVSQSLEHAAAGVHGGALPGRKFAVEAGDAAGVVVERVIDDGPVPMGPMVYVSADHAIRTIVCRCMPSEFEEAVASPYYDIRTLDSLPAATSAGTAIPHTAADIVGDRLERNDPAWLERTLRLPKSF